MRFVVEHKRKQSVFQATPSVGNESKHKSASRRLVQNMPCISVNHDERWKNGQWPVNPLSRSQLTTATAASWLLMKPTEWMNKLLNFLGRTSLLRLQGSCNDYGSTWREEMNQLVSSPSPPSWMLFVLWNSPVRTGNFWSPKLALRGLQS